MGYWVVITAHAFERALNEELAQHGITFRQWQVLAWLAHEGDLSQNELADRMSIEAPTLVGILDRMQRDGWITRESDPGDRRRKIIRATERVEPVWEKMVTCARRVRARAAEGLDRRQLEETKRVLEAMGVNLRSEQSPVPRRRGATQERSSVVAPGSPSTKSLIEETVP